jgi:hypothetical protein
MVITTNEIEARGEEGEHGDAIGHVEHGDEASAITDDSLLLEANMTESQKRKKLEMVFLTTDYVNVVNEDEYEIMKINRVIRNNIFPKIKFCRGEGNAGTSVKQRRGIRHQRLVKKIALGKSHEMADLIKTTGFEVEVLKLCGMGADRKTITQRGNWWKTYNYHVKKEIRTQRGQAQYTLRKTMNEGKNYSSDLVSHCLQFIITQEYQYFAALLQGKVHQSSTTRLQHHFGKNVASEEYIEDSIEQVKAKAWKLVQLMDTDMISFEKIRSHPDDDYFETFVDYCLNVFVSSQTWRYKAYNTLISKIFTPSDEAMAMLLLENNARDLKRVHETGQTLPRKESFTKYTKPDKDSQERFQGWSKLGIQRYNELHRIVVTQRTQTASKDKEEILLGKYRMVVGKSVNFIGDNNSEEDISGDEMTDDEDVYAIDGFELGDDGTVASMPLLNDNSHGTSSTTTPV